MEICCLQRVPPEDDEHGTKWPEEWRTRLKKIPYWLKKDVHNHFIENWKRIVRKLYLPGMGID